VRVKELVCIACPLACRLTVTEATGGDPTVSGNRCARGEAYGREEMLAPRRIVTAVVPTASADFPCAPVRTEGTVPRETISRLLMQLYAARVRLPVRQGQVFMADYEGTRVVFTRTLPPDEIPAVGEARAEAEGQDEIP
jgi:CxxC motif-containing protein